MWFNHRTSRASVAAVTSRTVIGLSLLLSACAVETSSIDQTSTVCGDGPTVKGMDVSYYDDAVDWTAAHAAPASPVTGGDTRLTGGRSVGCRARSLLEARGRATTAP